MPFFNILVFIKRFVNVRFLKNLLGLLLTLGVGYVMYQRDVADGSVGDPPAAIDTTAVQERLTTIAKAEWQFHAEHNTYATLEELASNDQMQGGPVQYGYHFIATPSANGFHITATPIDEDIPDWPTLVIDETLQITEQ